MIRSRFRRENTSSKKRLLDMVDLYDWGLRQVILYIFVKVFLFLGTFRVDCVLSLNNIVLLQPFRRY